MNGLQKEINLQGKLAEELSKIYMDMENGYDLTAAEVGLSCQGCPDNCCDSYFLHHTYSEWAYLWQGFRAIHKKNRLEITARAEEYIQNSKIMLAKQQRPQLPCPLLDEKGLCSLYQHRMLVCRMHGIPADMTRPDGQSMHFPGCFRCQEVVAQKYPKGLDIPSMDRTGLFRRMVSLESKLLSGRRHLMPRVKMTIAEMIIKGPPIQVLGSCSR